MPINSVTMVNGVEKKQVDNTEGAPELAEPLEDQARVADASDGAEPQHHLLIDGEHRNQQQQRPEQRCAVVLTSLGVGPEGAGVIVADHDDETWTENGEKGLEPVLPAFTGTMVPATDGAEGAVDMADMGFVKNGGAGRQDDIGVHGSSPDP